MIFPTMLSNASEHFATLFLSLSVGLGCVFFSLPIAIPIGWILAKKSFPAKSLLSTLVLIPVVLPPVVTGYLLLSFFGNEGVFGEWLKLFGVFVPFSRAAAIIAAMIVGLPFFIMGARHAFEGVDSHYEDLAYTFGYSPWQTFFRITLPLALPGIGAGAVLSFARALGEFGATAIFAGSIPGETRTLSLAIYALLDDPDGEIKGRSLVFLSVSLALLTLICYEALNQWQRRRLEV